MMNTAECLVKLLLVISTLFSRCQGVTTPSATLTTTHQLQLTSTSPICPRVCQCFRPRTTLTYINCNDKSLGSFPNFSLLGQADTKTIILASQNSIKTLGEGVLSGLTNVQTVHLGDNEIVDIHVNWSSDHAVHIRTLNLAGNNLSDHAVTSALRHLVNLKNLDLSRNELVTINFLQELSLKNLQVLVAPSNP